LTRTHAPFRLSGLTVHYSAPRHRRQRLRAALPRLRSACADADADGDLCLYQYHPLLPAMPALPATPPRTRKKEASGSSPCPTSCSRSVLRGFRQRLLGLGHSPLQCHHSGHALRCACAESAEWECVAQDRPRSAGDAATAVATDAWDIPPEVLLWDLRCRLATAGVRPHSLPKAFQRTAALVRERPETTVDRALQQIKRVRRRLQRRHRRPGGSCGGCSVGQVARADGDDLVEICKVAGDTAPAQEVIKPGVRAKEAASMAKLSRSEWLKLCKSLHFTQPEAERLREILASGVTGAVDLRQLFATMRSIVAPDVSLERFVNKALTRYGSLSKAFDASYPKRGRMGWPEFRTMAESLSVNQANAQKLWDVLAAVARRQEQLDAAARPEGEDYALEAIAILDADGTVKQTITKDVFVQQLQRWMPDTALDTLAEQLCERFGSLAQGVHALECKGLCLTAPLSSTSLAAALRAIGIRSCDAERVLVAVSPRAGGRGGATYGFDGLGAGVGAGATLQDLLAAMQAIQRSVPRARYKARTIVTEDTLPLWRQLRAMQAELGCGTPPAAPEADVPRLQGAPPVRSRGAGGSSAIRCEQHGSQRSPAHLCASPLSPLYKAVAAVVHSFAMPQGGAGAVEQATSASTSDATSSCCSTSAHVAGVCRPTRLSKPCCTPARRTSGRPSMAARSGGA